MGVARQPLGRNNPSSIGQWLTRISFRKRTIDTKISTGQTGARPATSFVRLPESIDPLDGPRPTSPMPYGKGNDVKCRKTSPRRGLPGNGVEFAGWLCVTHSSASRDSSMAPGRASRSRCRPHIRRSCGRWRTCRSAATFKIALRAQASGSGTIRRPVAGPLRARTSGPPGACSGRRG